MNVPQLMKGKGSAYRVTFLEAVKAQREGNTGEVEVLIESMMQRHAAAQDDPIGVSRLLRSEVREAANNDLLASMKQDEFDAWIHDELSAVPA